MKILLYIGLLLLVCFLPVDGTDVGKLIPVEVIAISESEGMITVRTDTGDQGRGEDLSTAFADLKDSASGVIYLDTAEYVLLEPGTERFVDTAESYLKGDTKVCVAQEGIPLDDVANYLSVHHPGIRLEEVREVAEIPCIAEEDGRYWIQ